MIDKTKIAQRQQRYNRKFYRLTLRLHPSFEAAIKKAAESYGSVNAFIEHSIVQSLRTYTRYPTEFTTKKTKNHLYKEYIGDNNEEENNFILEEENADFDDEYDA